MDSNHKSTNARSEGQRGGGRGGRGRGRGNSGRGGRGNSRGGPKRKADMGRKEFFRQGDTKDRNGEEQAPKRRKILNEETGPTAYSTEFSKEEIENEERRPKRKVAVMIGYAGTGYKGLQINTKEKTIEGDMFKAFVAAGAISKANANDPKKSNLVRCARTDKGVHAAGNVLSLKLIVEDPNVVENINAHLPDQIRVWGIVRTTGSFNCYQTCDSRWYEYLIPTYSFIPPHPKSFLGKQLLQAAEKEGVLEKFNKMNEDAATFWDNAEKEFVQPILDKLDPQLAADVMEAIHAAEENNEPIGKRAKNGGDANEKSEAVAESIANVGEEPDHDTDMKEKADDKSVVRNLEDTPTENAAVTELGPETVVEEARQQVDEEMQDPGTVADHADNQETETSKEASKSVLSPLDKAVKEVKAAYIKAKKAYRIHESRKERVQEALNEYLGTNNFHNYTILKSFSDPSSKRHIKSFKIGPKPIIIHDTEWLSLKVHGQSFMMHQIRKMVAMAALVVRCATPLEIIKDTYTSAKISIPKAPSLGLLLEAPVFNNYNQNVAKPNERDSLDFENYREKMDEFKQREIYDRIFRVEDAENQFHTFFHHLDHHKSDYFLWLTASGISAGRQRGGKDLELDGSDDEADINGEEG
ncbi:tRNA pseudouridine synthase a protein [Rutstroemia sp. NJR-2017a WRK4]|nr:tRNA pseudouridine synthase a protein [Rutstroemia sp. NJR-2017a WRK4]